MIREALAVTPRSNGGAAALRARARAAREAITPELRDSATAAATGHALTALAALPTGAVIALYAAIRSELSTDALAQAARDRGLILAYPRVVDGDRHLAFHLATAAELAPGHFRIPEPDPGAPTVDPRDLAAIVVPALLFDRRGHRLGWGRGYYDATLPRAPSALRLGLGFEQQLVDRITTHAHDCPVQLIATEVALHRGEGLPP